MFKADHVTHTKSLEIQNVECYDAVKNEGATDGGKRGSWGWFLSSSGPCLHPTSLISHLTPPTVHPTLVLH